MASRILILVGMLAALGGSPKAAEPDGHAQLRRGIALQREASWASSITALEKARASGTLASAERVECAFYLAAAYLAIGSEASARRELDAVLEANPVFEPPPYTSPKLAALLGEVARARQSAASLEARPPRDLPADATRGSGVELGFEARRGKPPIYGIVRYRLRGEQTWREAPLAHRGNNEGSLWTEVRPATGGVLEYYADALSADGPVRAGSVAAPLELPVRIDPPRTPATRAKRGVSKLVWLAIPIGAVIGAGLGVGLYYGLRAR